MATWVALLRAVNLGSRNKIAMADLRALLTDLGYTDVRTHILSGNAVFASGGRSAAKHQRDIEAAIKEKLGLDIKAIVRSGTDLARIAEAVPFTSADKKALHVVFLSGPATADLAKDAYAPDEFAFGDRVVYVKLAGGVQRSRLPSWEKVLGGTATMRSVHVVRKLAELAGTPVRP
jgi:uncharacterized protein (DUF1697 family)